MPAQPRVILMRAPCSWRKYNGLPHKFAKFGIGVSNVRHFGYASEQKLKPMERVRGLPRAFFFSLL